MGIRNTASGGVCVFAQSPSLSQAPISRCLSAFTCAWCTIKNGHATTASAAATARSNRRRAIPGGRRIRWARGTTTRAIGSNGLMVSVASARRGAQKRCSADAGRPAQTVVIAARDSAAKRWMPAPARSKCRLRNSGACVRAGRTEPTVQSSMNPTSAARQNAAWRRSISRAAEARRPHRLTGPEHQQLLRLDLRHHEVIRVVLDEIRDVIEVNRMTKFRVRHNGMEHRSSNNQRSQQSDGRTPEQKPPTDLVP